MWAGPIVRFSYPRDFGRKGVQGSSSATTAAGSMANRAAQEAIASARKKMARREKNALPSVYVTTAMLNDAVGTFTRLLVLCRRCRRPRTTLYASKDCGDAPTPRSGGGVHHWRHRPAATAGLASAQGVGGGLTLWVECQEQDCGLTTEVVASGRRPRWLVKYAEFVLHRTWEVWLCLAKFCCCCGFVLGSWHFALLGFWLNETGSCGIEA